LIITHPLVFVYRLSKTVAVL